MKNLNCFMLFYIMGLIAPSAMASEPSTDPKLEPVGVVSEIVKPDPKDSGVFFNGLKDVLQGAVISEMVTLSPKVSGEFLAGLIVGPMISKPDLRLVRFSTPLMTKKTQICFRAITRDGVVSASPKQTLFVPPNTRLIRLATDATQSPMIPSYSTDDVAIRARLGKNCDSDNTAPFLPAYYTDVRTNLNIMINSGRALSVRVELSDEGGNKIGGSCLKNAAKSSVAFDMVCSLPLRGISQTGKSKLSFFIRSRLGNTLVEESTLVWS